MIFQRMKKITILITNTKFLLAVSLKPVRVIQNLLFIRRRRKKHHVVFFIKLVFLLHLIDAQETFKNVSSFSYLIFFL